MSHITEQALRAYDPKRWTLIPLRPNSKAPQDHAWTTRQYETRTTIERCILHNTNVGVRLTEEQLVIDVDPRNGGDKGFIALCQDLDIDPSAFPRVRTGSGGDHYYMAKPGNVPILDTLEADAYRGVEFKSRGRQVVSAGSIHPDSGILYEWVTPIYDPLPAVPDALLYLITRPQTFALTGGGQYTQEQIGKALAGLDACDYRDHDKWFTLMCCCHHASNGDARSEFVEWSTSDPTYKDHGELVGRRWDSLHRERPNGKVATYRTLNKILADAGKANLQAAGKAGDDFPDGDADDYDFDTPAADPKYDLDTSAEENWSGVTDESLESLMAMNEQYMSVVERGRFRIIYREHDPNPNTKRDYWARMEAKDFLLAHCNQRIERNTEGMDKRAANTLPLGKAWLEWPGRKQVKGVVFAPNQEFPDYLNVWMGFPFQGDPQGEWSYLRELIFEVLAQGDEEIDAYILNWIAYMIRHPDTRAEVALVFRGGRGVGKGTLGNALCKLVGRHAMAVASPELLTGRFTSHLQDTIFLFADEAIRPFDKGAESRLKAMITEPTLAFEGKYEKAILDTNYLHIMLASNEDWVIPAGTDERRFAMFDASAKWQGNEAKFNALHDQLNRNDKSGFKRMMLYFKAQHKLPKGWTPRKVPQTKALVDQKVRSLPPIQMFFHNVLCTGDLGMACKRGPWTDSAVRVFVEDFRSAFDAWCAQSRINPGSMGRSSTRLLLREVDAIFPNARTYLREPVTPDDMVRAAPSDQKAPTIELPALRECRDNFDRLLGAKYEWERKHDDFG